MQRTRAASGRSYVMCQTTIFSTHGRGGPAGCRASASLSFAPAVLCQRRGRSRRSFRCGRIVADTGAEPAGRRAGRALPSRRGRQWGRASKVAIPTRAVRAPLADRSGVPPRAPGTGPARCLPGGPVAAAARRPPGRGKGRGPRRADASGIDQRVEPGDFGFADRFSQKAAYDGITFRPLDIGLAFRTGQDDHH